LFLLSPSGTCGTADTDFASSRRAALETRANSPLSLRRASASGVTQLSQARFPKLKSPL